MTALRRRMLEDLQLRGLAPRAQQCSLAAVKHRAQHDRRAPDHMSEAELRQYFLDWLHEQQVADIDPQRMLVRVRQGKGGKDRLVPLAERTLELLRVYWQRARPRPWLFPARHQQTPLPATTLQKTLKHVVHQRGLTKDASMHTLRHSYATHR